MIPRLVLLTDRSQLQLGRALVRTVAECAEAGLEAVVVREHDLAPGHRSALVRVLAGLPGLRVISSRVLDPAADGVHLAVGQEVLGRPFGRSCHSAAQVRVAAAEGAQWATLSPYAETPSKPGYGPALGPEAFAGPWPVPVLALGGIGPDEAARAREAGAHGVAVMGSVMRADDPAGVVTRLLRAVT